MQDVELEQRELIVACDQCFDENLTFLEGKIPQSMRGQKWSVERMGNPCWCGKVGIHGGMKLLRVNGINVCDVEDVKDRLGNKCRECRGRGKQCKKCGGSGIQMHPKSLTLKRHCLPESARADGQNGDSGQGSGQGLGLRAGPKRCTCFMTQSHDSRQTSCRVRNDYRY